MFSPFFHRVQACFVDPGSQIVHRQSAALEPVSLIRALPALGDVVYVPMQSCEVMQEELPHGTLVEQWQLAALLQVCWLVQASLITVDGPREWIECLDRQGHLCCRLHLLPDTDYLAWDRLIGVATPTALPCAAASRRQARPACAQLLRFRQRSLGGLFVLGADTAGQLSPMGRVLAQQIARDEAVVLQC